MMSASLWVAACVCMFIIIHTQPGSRWEGLFIKELLMSGAAKWTKVSIPNWKQSIKACLLYYGVIYY